MTAQSSTDDTKAKGATGVTEGMLLMMVAMLVIPGIDAIAKFVSGSISSGQTAWARFLIQVVFLAPIVAIYPGLNFGRPQWVDVGRGCMLASATLLFFTALKFMPMAETIAIFFVQPFIVTLLAAGLLGEHFGLRRLLAIAIGFAGALLIIKPSYEIFGLAAILPIGAALSFSIYVVLTRMRVATASPIVMQFWAGISGLVAMSLALAVGYGFSIDFLAVSWPNAFEFQLLAMLGIIATSCHILIVTAYARASVGVLAPLQYLEILSATALGFAIFGDFPDALTWLGIGIIVACGLYCFYRERKLAHTSQ